MFRRNLFVVVVMLALILSAAFTSWTVNTSNAGTSVPPVVNTWPPDLTKYTRPATAQDVVSKPRGASTPMSIQPVEVPDSGGGEPDIAINPKNLNQIVIHAGFGGWTGDAPNFVSNDGGMTWSTRNQIPPPPGIAGTAGCPCDVTQDFGLDGNLYGTYLAFNNIFNVDVFSASNTNPFANLFSYFLAGGNAQRTDFNGTLGGADAPWLLTNVDPATPGQTDTYVGYIDFGAFPFPMRVSVATGTSPPDFVKDNVSGLSIGGINPGLRLAVDPRGGAVYSLYGNCLADCGMFTKPIRYVLNRSLDAGTTWTLNGSATGIQIATGTGVFTKFGTVNAQIPGINHAAVDPTTGDVFVVYGDANGVGGNAIFIKKITFDTSTPSNAIVGSAHQVSLPPVLSTDSAALPSVAVASDGTVGVLYTSFDGFSVDGFPIFSAHFASSTDAGTTFKDQTILTFLSPTLDNGDGRQRVLGDYQQLKTVSGPSAANAGATFYGAFTGNGAALGDATANNNAFFFKASVTQINPATVSITNPAADSTVSATVPFSCTDTTPGAVVNLYIDDVYVAAGNSPLTFSWDTTAVSNGSHYLVCNGYVNGISNGSAAENVTVSNVSNPPQTVSITSPAANSTVSATVPFSCTDTAPDSVVNLYIDDVSVAGGNSPFTFSWDTTAASNGSHYLVCNGYVNGGTNGSAAQDVTVSN